MPYKFVADSFHKKLSSRLSSSKMQFYAENGRLAFLVPFGGDVRLELIGKHCWTSY